MSVVKTLWASVQGDPVFMRRVNGWLAIFWIVVLMILFSFPTSGNISWPFMAATVLFLIVYYFAFAKRNFKGPHRQGDSAELTEIEREFEAAAGEVT